jgi:hypothetical protein
MVENKCQICNGTFGYISIDSKTGEMKIGQKKLSMIDGERLCGNCKMWYKNNLIKWRKNDAYL